MGEYVLKILKRMKAILTCTVCMDASLIIVYIPCNIETYRLLILIFEILQEIDSLCT